MHAKRDVGVLCGVDADFLHGHFVHSFLVAAFADQLVDLDRRMVEILLGEVVEVVAAAAGVEQIVGDHRVESQAGERDANVFEHDHVVLEVLAQLADGGVFEDGSERGERGGGIQHAVALWAADRHVERFIGLVGERIADDFGAARRDVRRLGVDADQRLLG